MKYSNYLYSGKNYTDITFSWDNYFLFCESKRGMDWKEKGKKKSWSTLYSIRSSFVSCKAEKHLNNQLQTFPCAQRWILSSSLGREAVEYTALICVFLREVMWAFPISRGGSCVYKSSVLWWGCTCVLLMDQIDTLRDTSARVKSANDKGVEKLLWFFMFFLSVQQ